jgi:glutamyl-tRNA reductase
VLEHLGLVGVSWRQGGSEALAEFALGADTVAARLQDFAQRMQLAELAYLSTCNRVELIFARSDRTPVQDLRRDAFQLLTGRAARRAKPSAACVRGRAKAQPSISF